MSINTNAWQSSTFLHGLDSEADAETVVTNSAQRVARGVRPSLKQVADWVRNKSVVHITAALIHEKDGISHRAGDSISGRISRIQSWRGDLESDFFDPKNNDATIWIENCSLQVADITDFEEMESENAAANWNAATPSARQCEYWFKHQSSIYVARVGQWSMELVQGRITRIVPFVREADMQIQMNGNVYLSIAQITECAEEVVVMSAAEESLDAPVETEILLISGEAQFRVSLEKLQAAIPYFRGIRFCKESIEGRMDLSLTLSPRQLKLLLQYVDAPYRFGQFTELDVIELFIVADRLSDPELLHLFRCRSTVIQDIWDLLHSERHELNFAHRIGENYVEHIVRTLRVASIVNARIERVAIPNLEDSQFPLVVGELQQHIGITHCDMSRSCPLQAGDRLLTSASAPFLQNLIQGLPSLKRLKITGHALGDESLPAIAEAVKEHPSLVKLNLNENDFSQEAFEVFTANISSGHRDIAP